MADLGGMFGYSFGGDFANSFAKGMQIGLMQRQMEMNEKKMMQDYEMNHLLKEEMGLKVRAQRNALEEANRYRQQWEEFKKPTEITHEIPTGGDEFSGPTDMRTETLQGPSKLQQMFPGQTGQILEMGGPDMLKAIAPTMVKEATGSNLGEVGKSIRDLDLITQKYGSDHPFTKLARDRLEKWGVAKFPNEIELQARALQGDTEAQKILSELDSRKRAMFEIRIPPYSAGAGLPPGYVLNRRTGNYEWRGEGPAPGMDLPTVADYQGLKKSITTQENTYGMMGQFVGNLNGQIGKVDRMMKDVINRVGVRAIDIPIREFKTRFMGSGQERVLESYLMEISREIGKLSTGSQASIAELSVEAQKKWDKIHDPNLSLKDLSEVLNATKEQANIRKESALANINETKQRIKGLSSNGQAQPISGSKTIKLKSGKEIIVGE